MSRTHSVWQRMQETPLELAICLLAACVSVVALVHDGARMPWHLVALTVALGLGGAVGAAGRFADNPDTESAGIALLLAALLFMGVRDARDIEGLANVSALLMNYGALIAGFGIRLLVVRRAARARRRAAELLAERRDGE